MSLQHKPLLSFIDQFEYKHDTSSHYYQCVKSLYCYIPDGYNCAYFFILTRTVYR